MQGIANSYESEINETVRDLFETMLATKAEPTTHPAPKGTDTITAIMAFAGSWKGDLLLECGRAQALAFAQRFLQTDDLDSHSEDVTSTVAEMSNIIAGNLKVVLPPGVSMGTPSVVEGANYDVRVCGGKVINETFFVTDAGPFAIRLVEASGQSKDRNAYSNR
jgi:CheY-specific phosphatase CheX